MKKLVFFIDSSLERLTTGLLVTSLSLMLVISLFNIVLRWFEITFLWFDPLVRHLVFLSAFLGGSLATAKKTHIRIDLISTIAKKWEKTKGIFLLNKILILVSMGTVCWLTLAAWEFTKVELQYGRVAFLGIHSGVLVGIIPFGFLLIAIRLLKQLFWDT
jgi:TRAP-type C4-dicarboxylate transport system permease small subunit